MVKQSAERYFNNLRKDGRTGHWNLDHIVDIEPRSSRCDENMTPLRNILKPTPEERRTLVLQKVRQEVPTKLVQIAKVAKAQANID